MSQFVDNGDSNATVILDNLQELDRDGNVILEWNCWDHFDVRNAIHENLRAKSIDYVHMNSIAVDYDGNFVISSHNLSEVTKINRQTGAISWRLEGVNDQFQLVNDADGISYLNKFFSALTDTNYKQIEETQ